MRAWHLVYSLICTILLAVAQPTAAHGASASPTTLMLVGSSTTHGSAGDHTWRYRLWHHLAGNGVPVDFVGPFHNLYNNSEAYADPDFDQDHYAQWGRFLGTFNGYPVGAKDTINAQVSAYLPDYVVVMLGLNDLSWFTTRAPSAVAADMETFIANSRAARPDVRLVLVAVQPTRSALSNATLASRIAEYNQRLSGIATTLSTVSSPIAFVSQPQDFQPDYNQNPHDTYDGTHANARGELRIADAVADVLSARFGLGPAFPLSLEGVALGPVLPFQLECLPGNNMAFLTWTESPGATGYWFQRRVAGSAWDPPVYQLKMTDSPLTNIYLTNGVTYQYRLQAAKWYDRGIFSNVCSVTPTA